MGSNYGRNPTMRPHKRNLYLQQKNFLERGKQGIMISSTNTFKSLNTCQQERRVIDISWTKQIVGVAM